MNIKYGYLDKEMQEYYHTLPKNTQNYIDLRGKGFTRTKAYEHSGYKSKSPNNSANNMERRNPNINKIVECILNHNKLGSIVEKDGELSRQIDLLENSDQAKRAMEVLEKANTEETERIIFYKNIIGGKTKTTNKTVTKDKDGNIIQIKEEIKEATLTERMNARKTLDTLLGLNDIPSIVGTIDSGPITINIVNASNSKEVNDVRNNAAINADFTEIVGEDNLKKEVVDNGE